MFVRVDKGLGKRIAEETERLAALAVRPKMDIEEERARKTAEKRHEIMKVQAVKAQGAEPQVPEVQAPETHTAETHISETHSPEAQLPDAREEVEVDL